MENLTFTLTNQQYDDLLRILLHSKYEGSCTIIEQKSSAKLLDTILSQYILNKKDLD